MAQVSVNIKVQQSGEDRTRTKLDPQFPRHPNGPVFLELDGPATSIRFQSLDHLNEWVAGLRYDVDVLLERRDAQQTLDAQRTWGGAA